MSCVCCNKSRYCAFFYKVVTLLLKYVLNTNYYSVCSNFSHVLFLLYAHSKILHCQEILLNVYGIALRLHEIKIGIQRRGF